MEQREAAEAAMEAMEAMEAAAEEGGEAEGEGGEAAEERIDAAMMERFHSILPYSGPTIPDYIKARLANRGAANSGVANRRVANQRSPYPARRPVRRPARKQPFSSSMNRRRLLLKRPATGRSAGATMPVEGGEGLMYQLTQTGSKVWDTLTKVFVKEAETGLAGRGMKDLLEEVADSLAEELMHQLDPDGCLQKLLCHLQERSSDSLTPEEGVLASVFLFRRPHAQCTDDHFPFCFISVQQLEALLPPAPQMNTNAIP